VGVNHGYTILDAMAFPETDVGAAALPSAELLGCASLKVQVILEFVMGQDVFALLPTGYG